MDSGEWYRPRASFCVRLSSFRLRRSGDWFEDWDIVKSAVTTVLRNPPSAAAMLFSPLLELRDHRARVQLLCATSQHHTPRWCDRYARSVTLSRTLAGRTRRLRGLGCGLTPLGDSLLGGGASEGGEPPNTRRATSCSKESSSSSLPVSSASPPTTSSASTRDAPSPLCQPSTRRSPAASLSSRPFLAATETPCSGPSTPSSPSLHALRESGLSWPCRSWPSAASSVSLTA